MIQFLHTNCIKMLTSSVEGNGKIEEIMSTNVVTLDISKSAAHAANLTTEKNIGSVIVYD